ncbi:hypothetical protein EPD60_06435 [Flaviaesturariibacter flavus]|uniref:Four-helix bundle copper-binding protein n=1 Tax=Flaviaesturariibacter flavus TaxID=2502780 RepID=A0A4R1BKG5_9BACT|nr:hypothetical protein [Flaviaesturariibacter flavus]TCJ17816.1 hypothetical protein EPD60_06435 [Flaviaesturariibacter flavus]
MTCTVLSIHCLEAWRHCETLLGELERSACSISQRTRRVLDECAGICLDTHHALLAGAGEAPGLALLCVGICVECAEVCGRYAGSSFRTCADACMACAEALAGIAEV